MEPQLWGGGDAGLQGVTELEECERCDDEWLRELQDQFRRGGLTEDNHNFLHGRPTTVCGSFVDGDVTCDFGGLPVKPKVAVKRFLQRLGLPPRSRLGLPPLKAQHCLRLIYTSISCD